MARRGRLSKINNQILKKYPRKANGRTYLGTGVASILVALIILTLSCFAALTYLTADSKMDVSEKSRTYCDEYYKAETTASELLDTVSSHKATSSKGETSSYDTASGTVVVTRAGNYISFLVPMNKKQNLEVEANVSGESVDISTWKVVK